MARVKESNFKEESRALLDRLKAQAFSPVYLVMGDQDYLRTQYRDFIRDALVPGGDAMNSAYYTGDQYTVQEIIDLAETLPFFADRRVITIENSGWFGKNAGVGEQLVDYIARMPETTHLVLVEWDVDRVRRPYKAVKKLGDVLNCATPDKDMLSAWIMQRIGKTGLGCTQDAMDLFLEYAGSTPDMMRMGSELDKLISYCLGRKGITRADVETMCRPADEDRIFDMIGNVTVHRTGEALAIYMDLLRQRTAPQQILALMVRNYNQLLQVCELAGRGVSSDEIASMLHANAWVIRNKVLPVARGQSSDVFARALNLCLQADQDYKAGRISDQLAVEELIIRCAGEL